jgi:hypothetical protein
MRHKRSNLDDSYMNQLIEITRLASKYNRLIGSWSIYECFPMSLKVIISNNRSINIKISKNMNIKLNVDYYNDSLPMTTPMTYKVMKFYRIAL